MKKLLIIMAALAAVSFGQKANASVATSTGTAAPSAAMVAKPTSGYLYLKGCSFSSLSGNCITLKDGATYGAATAKIQLCAVASTTVMGGGLSGNTQGASQTGDIVSALGESIVFSSSVWAVANTTQAGDLLTCAFGVRLQ